ncbi:hypothetical protein Hanom_Chr11g01040401 [Helianthus anomalus]
MIRHKEALTQTLLYHTRRPFARNTNTYKNLVCKYIIPSIFVYTIRKERRADSTSYQFKCLK